MLKMIIKYQSIYIFLIGIILIGLITGNIYYKLEPQSEKENIKNNINITETIQDKSLNILTNIKYIFLIYISSILILPELLSITKLFYESFKIGFILNIIKTINPKCLIIYLLIYEIIPLIFLIILNRISLSISYNNLKIIIRKDNKTKITRKKLIKKIILITIIYILYIFITILFKSIINNYLLTLI